MFANAFLVVTSLLLSFIFSEVVYRGYVYWTLDTEVEAAITASRDANIHFGAYDQPAFEFDPVSGFNMLPDRQFLHAVFRDGLLARCDVMETNEIGQVSNNQLNAEVSASRILVVGDSMTVYGWDGITWPGLLEQALNQGRAQKVDVINVGRAGIGVLQMFDIIAQKIPVYEPDIVLIVFITDDIDRKRSYILPNETSPGQLEYMLTYGNQSEQGPMIGRHLNQFTDSRINERWCTKALGVADNPLTVALNNRYLRAYQMKDDVIRAERHSPDIVFSMQGSFLVDRIWRGNALYAFDGVSALSHKTSLPLAEDGRFLDSLATVQRSGVRFELVHMPLASELERGQKYILGAAYQQDQLRELTELTGKKIKFLADDMLNLSAVEISKIPISDNDQHPTKQGLSIYANAVLAWLTATWPEYQN